MYSEKKLQQILDYQHGKSTQYMWATDAGRWNAFDDPNRQDVMPTANTDWLHELFGDNLSNEKGIRFSRRSSKWWYGCNAVLYVCQLSG